MEWSPIKTAPLETAVLVYCPKINNYNRPAGMESLIIVGIQRRHRDSTSWVADLIETSPDYYDGTCIDPDFIDPTHWMPLPDKPKTRK